MELKSCSWELKDVDDVKGTVECVFSTFGVRDHDGDVTLAGAFTEGQACAISAYGHRIWDGAPPVGKGTITSNTKEARFKGQFFMDIPTAKETFLAVKGMGDLQEWSYGFDIVDAEMGEKDGERVRFLKAMSVYEVSPVLRGAGIRTRTTSAKNRTGEGTGLTVPTWMGIPGHETRVIQKGWDGVDFGNGAISFEALRATHAAWNPLGDPLDRKSYALPHHEREGGPANVDACLLAIGSLIVGAKGLELDETQRKAAHGHLAGHLEDAGVAVPDLDPGDGPLKMYSALVGHLAATDGILNGMRSVMGQRSGRGAKALTGAVHHGAELLQAKLRELRDVCDMPQQVAEREYLKFLRDSSGFGDGS